MDMNQFSESRYLTGAEIAGRRFAVTLSDVKVEEMDDGADKPVLYFQGAKKGLVLNATNRGALIEMFGAESNDWIGKRVELFTVKTQNPAGATVDGIRVGPVASVEGETPF